MLSLLNWAEAGAGTLKRMLLKRWVRGVIFPSVNVTVYALGTSEDKFIVCNSSVSRGLLLRTKSFLGHFSVSWSCSVTTIVCLHT